MVGHTSTSEMNALFCFPFSRRGSHPGTLGIVRSGAWDGSQDFTFAAQSFFFFFKKKSAPVMRYYPGLVTLDKASCLASAGDYLPTYKVPNLGT